MKSISWLFSAGLSVVTEFPLWLHIVGVHYFSTLLRLQVRWISDFCRGWSPATRGAIRRFDISRTPTSTTANRCVWPAGSDCTDRKASKRGGRYSIKSDQTVSRFIFILTTALLSHKIFCLFSVRNCLFAPEKEPTRKLRAGVTLGHSEADWKIS